MGAWVSPLWMLSSVVSGLFKLAMLGQPLASHVKEKDCRSYASGDTAAGVGRGPLRIQSFSGKSGHPPPPVRQSRPSRVCIKIIMGPLKGSMIRTLLSEYLIIQDYNTTL